MGKTVNLPVRSLWRLTHQSCLSAGDLCSLAFPAGLGFHDSSLGFIFMERNVSAISSSANSFIDLSGLSFLGSKLCVCPGLGGLCAYVSQKLADPRVRRCWFATHIKSISEFLVVFDDELGSVAGSEIIFRRLKKGEVSRGCSALGFDCEVEPVLAMAAAIGNVIFEHVGDL